MSIKRIDKMRYASIRELDISNGRGVGISLFVQGCHFHCKNCFNKETWDFDGGKEWNDTTKSKLFELLNRPYINHISFLGGEPLCEENRYEVTNIVKECRKRFPDKKIWLWSGYTFNQISKLEVVEYLDYIIDGQFIDELKDMNLAFRGSSNQKIWFKDDSGMWKYME
jgi:anaerobic ribonucleoside-triphosphate reductase activating protein